MQVDNNMETLRRALQDNREVFVNIINKTNEDFETKNNNLVEDLEKVADIMQQVRVKVDQGQGQGQGQSQGQLGFGLE